ncbi:MAG TPA: hypothetical protein VES42_01840, partial [Pilimelia sp.]|nr:hypothetical protein [Pilimelia sp.]
MRGPGEWTRLRYGGLAGAALLAAGAYGAGALPGADPARSVRTGVADPARYGAGLAACVLGVLLLT